MNTVSISVLEVCLITPVKCSWLLPAFILLSGAGARAEPLLIDLTGPTPPPVECPYGPRGASSPAGKIIAADSQSFFLGGQPWIPIVGEFHYARYAHQEWRDELLKMKAGGLNTVSTYVFWIHHEEERGTFDWSGQRSLREFLQLAHDVGLKAIVRMGPYCHGEARNGGLPDWVQKSGTQLRRNDPKFLAFVEPFYKEQAAQMKGLLWKEGGPVVGIQLDNENDKGDYLLALKKMAIDCGIDVPLYTITGWQGGVPQKELIPLFGGYVDGFWGGSIEEYRRETLFTSARGVNDLGAQLQIKNPTNSQTLAQFPYACVEIGPGMASSYRKRVNFDPRDPLGITTSKLGSGNNMPGYYMYHGGTNPEGKLTYLHEDRPNALPVKNYDFNCSLDSYGRVRPVFHHLRQQHLFLEDFGARLARMPAYFPAEQPKSLKDFDTLRWAVRSDGKSGFLFFNNRQPYQPLPEHKGVQFALKSTAGTQLVPREPFTMPSGAYGIWPINLDFDGVTLEYATAQPLCRIEDGKNIYYFMIAIEGIPAELAFPVSTMGMTVDKGEKAESNGRTIVRVTTPSTDRAVSVAKADGGTVNFVVLWPEQAMRIYRVPIAGRPTVVMSEAVPLVDGPTVRLHATDPGQVQLSLCPATNDLLDPAIMFSGHDGVFKTFTPSRALQVANQPKITLELENPAGPKATTLKGTEEATWDDAAVYKINIPAGAEGRKIVADFNYIGDATRLYVGDKLIDDHYYNGNPQSLALWRVPAADWSKLRLKVLPYSDGLMGRLPPMVKPIVEAAKAAGTLNEIKVTTTESFDVPLRVEPAKP